MQPEQAPAEKLQAAEGLTVSRPTVYRLLRLAEQERAGVARALMDTLALSAATP